MRALLSVANRDGIAAFARDLRRSTSRSSPPMARASTSRRTASRSARRGPDRRPAAGRRPGQDVPSRDLRGHPRPPRRPGAARRARGQGIGSIDIVVVNVKPFAPAVGARLVGIDEAIEMIDVGGAALLGAAARNARRGRGRRPARPTTRRHRRAARARPRSAPETRGAAGRGGVQHGRGVPRRDRRLPQPDLRQRLPERLAMVLEKVDDLRYGENPHQRAAFYRETTHRSGTARRRRRQLQGEHAVVQQPPRPRRRLPDRPRLHGADGRDRQAHGPGRASRRATSSSRPTGARSRPTRSRRSAASSASTASSTGRRRGDRGEFLRGGRRAGLQPGGHRHPAAQGRPGAPRGPARPDRGHARLRHRQPRLQAHRRRPAGRDASTSSGSTAASCRSSPSAGRRSRS